MMKKGVLILLVSALVLSSALAEIVPPMGESEAFYQFTGILAKEGVVLCQSLTVRDHPSAKAIDTLYYGDRFMDAGDGFDGYLHIYYGDGQKEGWVDRCYVAVDPAWFVTEEMTPAYAWGDADAPRVALIDKGEKMPILHETADFYVVSLRGASAWIQKEIKETLPDLTKMASLTAATLHIMENGVEMRQTTVTDATALGVISSLLTDSVPTGFATACPFGRRLLELTCADGTIYTLDMAADDCRVFILNGQYIEYGASREGIYSDMVFSLFE